MVCCLRNDGQDQEDVCPRPGGRAAGRAQLRLAAFAGNVGYGTRIAGGQLYLQRLGVMTRLTG